MPPTHRSAPRGTSTRTLMPARLAFVRVLCLASLLGAMALSGPAARAADYYVAPSGHDNASGLSPDQPLQTIQRGVNAAAAGDTVHVAAGTYTGDGNRNIDFAAADGSTKDITLMGDINNPGNCILDLGGSADAPARACQFYHQETNKMVFEGFTVQNGYRPHVGGAIDINLGSGPTIRDCTFQGNAAGDYGGAISAEGGGTPIVQNCTFINNTAQSGGGVYAEGSDVTVTACTFKGNSATSGSGGGMFVASTDLATVNNCAFDSNSVKTLGDGGGGGLSLTSVQAGNVSGCNFAGNSVLGNNSEGGGADINSCGTASFLRCTFTGNSVTYNGSSSGNSVAGGALLARYGSLRLIDCILTGNQLIGNDDARGGAVDLPDVTSTGITNCVIAGNTARARVVRGGAVRLPSFSNGLLSAVLTNCTITQNQANGAQVLGIALDAESPNANLAVDNCVVYGNTASDTNATTISADLQAPAPVVSYSDVGGGYSGNGNIDADPLFVGPYNRTTGAFDLSLQPGSPCTGAGTTNAPNYSPTDITGAARANPPTIGAYEGTSATTRTSLKSSANPSTVGQGVTFTATVTNTSQGSGAIPAGMVSFFLDNGSVATIALDGNGQATYSTSSLKAGSHTVTATFAANVRFQGGTSSPLSQSVVALPPAANPQTVSVAHDTATAVTLMGSDPNSPPLPLTYIVVSSPSHGTLSGTAPNLTYTPNAGYQGSDSFTFKVNNGVLDSSTATVTLNVAPGTPTASSQSVAVAHDTAKGITLTGTDPDTPLLPLVFALATGPAHGTVSGFSAATGAVTYTPSAGYQGADSFTFTVSNGTNTSAPATVTLTVTAGVPTANPQTVTTSTNTAKQITLTGTDPDVPALPLTYSIGPGPAHGTLTGLNASTGAVTYTPTAGYFGTDTFTFTVRNGTNTSAPATVMITVTDATPPVVTATADKTSLWPPNGKATTVTISGKVTDAGSGPASTGSYTVTDSEGTSIPGGTFTIKADGTYAFTLNLIASRSGGDKDGRTYTVTVTARDNAGNVGTATLTVTVPHDQGK